MISADDIRTRFRKNLTRVRHLLDIFRGLHPGSGRPSALKADVVRAAVLFLHAALEDLLRSSEELRFPHAPASAFSKLKWVTSGSKKADDEKLSERLTLAEFAAFRGQTVNDVLLRAFQRHHERSNYNNEKDVVGAVERMGLDTSPFQRHLADLSAMMSRRHVIAHRADIHTRLPHLTNPITVKLVERWLDAVEAFGSQLLSSV